MPVRSYIAITSKFHLEGPGLPAYLIDRLVVTLASVRIACNHRFDANNTMQGEQNSRRSSMNSDGDDDLCPLMCYRLRSSTGTIATGQTLGYLIYSQVYFRVF